MSDLHAVGDFVAAHRVALAAAVAFGGLWWLADAVNSRLGAVQLVVFCAYLAAAALVAYRFGRSRAGQGDDGDAQQEIARLRAQLDEEREVAAALRGELHPDAV